MADVNISNLSHNVLQSVWDLRLGYEDYLRSPLFPVALSVGYYLFLCTIFMVVDMLGERLPFMHRLKLQPDKPVKVSQLYDTIYLTFWNHIIFILPASVAQWVWTPPTTLPELAPSLWEFVWHQCAALVVFDFQYFVWHWVHHRVRFLYKHVHSVHHRYHSPFSWVTQYLHPWELITVGFLTTTNTWFFRCHCLTTWSYMIVSISVSVEAHIGFDFPFAPHNWFPFGLIGGAPKHDMHHLRPWTNFQPFFTHFDRLFDTHCPFLMAGGKKSKDLIEYEHRHRETKKQG